MSNSEQGDLVSLSVRAGDIGTEIFVIDSQFQLAARGVGELETKLKPGIYSIKVQAGSEAREEHIVLRPGDEPHKKTMAPLEFTSAAPLYETSRTHEYQQSAASDHSGVANVVKGTGSAIYFFTRDWSKAEAEETQRSPLNPARKLEIRELNGDTIARLGEDSAIDFSRPDPWAACNVEVSPGLYTLSLELPSGDRLEQTVVASPGWQTQVFLLQRDYGPRPEDRLADLPGASILLGRYSPGLIAFQPWDRATRLVELVRIGLVGGRHILSEEVRSMLSLKYDNPMLGIYGGYLLLQESEPDLDLLQIVIGNLRGLLGDHPDVEALALALPNDSSDYAFEFPPMLRHSWGRILAASVKKPHIVPAGSQAARISSRLWGSDLWLQWLKPADEMISFAGARSAAEKGKTDYTAAEKILVEHLQTTAARSAQPADSVFRPGAVAFALETTDDLEADTQELDEETIAQLVQALGMPRAEIEKMAAEIGDKG